MKYHFYELADCSSRSARVRWLKARLTVDYREAGRESRRTHARTSLRAHPALVRRIIPRRFMRHVALVCAHPSPLLRYAYARTKAPFLPICLMIRPRVSRRDRLRVCVRIRSIDRRRGREGGR